MKTNLPGRGGAMRTNGLLEAAENLAARPGTLICTAETRRKEHPIIFSGEMVCAILSGRKTQTRRVITQANSLCNGGRWYKSMPFAQHERDNAWPDGGPSPAGNTGPYLHVPFPDDGIVNRIYPIYWPGELMWVRENWRTIFSLADVRPSNLMPGAPISYDADNGRNCRSEGFAWGKCRPSIFMPRWASRLTLEITKVRVERVKDISEEDAIAEGLEPAEVDMGVVSAREQYEGLWDDLNAKRGLGWEKNPWVWVIEFRRVAP